MVRLGNPKRSRDGHRRLIKTTHRVATVLSSDFGIRSGYEVVDFDVPRLKPSKPIVKGNTRAADAIRIFCDRQTRQAPPQQCHVLLTNPDPDKIIVGNIVEATTGSFARKHMLLILSRTSQMLEGAVLVSGSETILHDVLPGNELFLTATKATFNVSSVTAIIDPHSVVLRYGWDETRPAYVGLSECAAQLAQGEERENVTFHEGDFVMLAPEEGGPLFDIVQVHRMRNLNVLVRKLYRQALQATIFKHDRLLIPARELKSIERSSFKPVMRCHVSLLTGSASSWSLEATEFFITLGDATLLRPECNSCAAAHRTRRQVRRSMSPLSAMELMCGAGGLSIGLDLSGACETKYAIDEDVDSVQTFKNHHSTAQVYCSGAGEALQRAVAGLKSEEGKDFPRRGDVDVIAAGPPCQGFSRKNQLAAREEAGDDLRNLLVCTVLGWVDHLQPNYFLLENVEGFTAAKLEGHNQGMVKLVMKCLLSLGYGVTCGYVQSGALGCPQSRGRFVLLAAREGVALPMLPPSTHHFLGKGASRFSWVDGDRKHHSTALATTTAAVLPAVTVNDAINDLPIFDWHDPHCTYAGPDQIELSRERQRIPQMQVNKGKAAGFAAKQHLTCPLNSYQERMRVLAGQTITSVTQHQTSGYDPKVVEQVVNVALYPGANYGSWSQPDINKPDLLDKHPVRQLNAW